MIPAQKNFYELLYHERSRFFLQKFGEELGVHIFGKALNMTHTDAKNEAIKLGNAMDAYSRKLYSLEIKAQRFKKSYAHFILQPEVIALRFIYILNTLAATYPQCYHKLFEVVAAYIFQGNTKARGNTKICQYWKI